MDHQPAIWRKSSYSGSETNCVEVAAVPAGFAVRDSNDPDAGVLTFGAATWAEFLDRARGGQLNPDGG